MRFEAKLPDDSVNVSPGSPVGEALLLIVGVAGLVLALTVAVAFSLDLLIPKLPATIEFRLCSALRDSFGTEDRKTPPDRRVERVQSVLDRMAARWEDSPYPKFEAHIVTRDEVNAFALPGGVVVVTSALLDRIGSENELAFILGHELGHFAGRDHLRGIGRELALAIAWSLLGSNGAQAGQLVGVLGTLASRGFDRQQESQADAFGLRLLVAEYGHAGGTREVFEHVLSTGTTDETSSAADPKRDDGADPEATGLGGLASYWSTHPLSASRIRDLEQRIDQAGVARDGERVPWPRSIPSTTATPNTLPRS